MFPRLSAGEKASVVRVFALAGLSFEAGGKRQLLDKLAAEYPPWKDNRQIADLMTSTWLPGLKEVQRYLHGIRDGAPCTQ